MITERPFCKVCASRYGKQLWAGACVCSGDVDLAFVAAPPLKPRTVQKEKTFMEHVTVESRPGWGPFKDAIRWHLCYRGNPMGDMHRFYPTGKLRNPYPIKGEAALHGWATEEEARKTLPKLKDHVNEVLNLPMVEREGASRLWT